MKKYDKFNVVGILILKTISYQSVFHINYFKCMTTICEDVLVG